MKEKVSPAVAGIAVAVVVVLVLGIAWKMFGPNSDKASAADQARYEKMRADFYSKPHGAPPPAAGMRGYRP